MFLDEKVKNAGVMVGNILWAIFGFALGLGLAMLVTR